MNIVKSGKSYRFFNEVVIEKQLKVGIYSLEVDIFGNCYLDDSPEFTIPAKIFDLEKDFRLHVLKSFHSFSINMGVVLDGMKGQGKSVNAKLLCMESNLPVIMITKRINKNVDFVAFLNSIQQEYVLFIDEFEKMFKPSTDAYGREKDDSFHGQEIFLTMMDGALSTNYKKLFLFTTNSIISDYFINRPSRVKFYKKYEFMPKELYNLIVEDRLVNKDFKEDLSRNLALVECTIDLLVSIIDEINVHNVPYSAFKEFFNHRSRTINYTRYKYDGKDFIYLDFITTNEEIERKTSYFYGSPITVVSVENDSIIYKATENKVIDKPSKVLTDDQVFEQMNLDADDEDDIEGKLEKVTVFYKVKKSMPRAELVF